MYHDSLSWNADGQEVVLGLDRQGSGPTLLLLPALSSISTRRELQPLQERLAARFTTVVVDWPGFGTMPKPCVDWRPALYAAYLDHLFTSLVPRTFAVLAAGHAAGYMLGYCAEHRCAVERLVLLSPTWRGPLPTMVNARWPVFVHIARAIDRPLLGPLLYVLNVNRFMVGVMARGHVYADPHWLRGERLAEKLAVTRSPGARHGSARFVTGCLDPFGSRTEFLDAAQRITVPVLNVFAKKAPRKSRAEMEALASLPNVKTVRLPRGKLSFYEEFPDETADVVREFLNDST